MKKITELLLLVCCFFSASLLVGQQTFKTNDFRIGMFGFNFMTNVPWDVNSTNYVALTTPLLNGNPTSVLNVLKADGFNTTQIYNPGTYNTSENTVFSMASLVQNHGMKIVFMDREWYKPTTILSSHYDANVGGIATETSGINLYDNSDNTAYRYNDPSMLMKVRTNYLNMINTVYSNSNVSSAIWGQQLCEEASAYHPFNPGNTAVGWNDLYPANYFTEIPPENVSASLNFFKSALQNKGIIKQKVIVMEANHGKTINDNSSDGNGIYQPQSYVKLLNFNDNRDVFFEGSYVQFPGTDWLNPNNSYAKMLNSNGPYYLGTMKSIDYAKKYC